MEQQVGSDNAMDRLGLNVYEAMVLQVLTLMVSAAVTPIALLI